MSLKSDIEKQLGIPVKVKAGMPGSLDVYAGVEKIYSKAQTGKLPQSAEIISAIKRRQAA